MKIVKKDFPQVLLDNENAYFSLLEALISSVDSNAYMEVRKCPLKYSFRISLSMPVYMNSLVEEINHLHNLLNIRVDYGKSLKNSGSLSFNLTIS